MQDMTVKYGVKYSTNMWKVLKEQKKKKVKPNNEILFTQLKTKSIPFTKGIPEKAKKIMKKSNFTRKKCKFASAMVVPFLQFQKSKKLWK